jgi:amylosucrase
MMHAWMFSQTGIPVIYSGDEIGQLNDYSYHDDPSHCEDSRYVHRGKFDFALAEKRYEEGTMQQVIFDGLQKLKNIRAEYDAFRSDADVFVYYTGDDRVMGLLRRYGEQTLICLFNFSEQPVDIMLFGSAWKDILTGEQFRASDDGTALLHFDGYGFRWLLEEEK